MRGIEVVVSLPMSETETVVKGALAEEGFGVLSEIDVASVLASKIGVQKTPLKILGACNPHIAHRALEQDPSVSLLLPCNVVIESLGDSSTRVVAVDPLELMAGDEFKDLATEAREHIQNALLKLPAVT